MEYTNTLLKYCSKVYVFIYSLFIALFVNVWYDELNIWGPSMMPDSTKYHTLHFSGYHHIIAGPSLIKPQKQMTMYL